MEIKMAEKRNKKIILMMATLLLGSFITTLAETLMNNGLPMIMEETHVSQMNAQWLNLMLYSITSLRIECFATKECSVR